jgi:HD-GYP domain-containing protein (c-di-GMP phosphodiesterase class II)
VWSPAGQLLLRKGQLVLSEQHRDKLQAHQASSTASDAQAWQRSYERMVHAMLGEGIDVQTIARAPMPSEIQERDFVVGSRINGGWLDLQETLRGILYQGGLAINPLERLEGIAEKALSLLEADPDDSLFALFQALADDTLGYCATHALLCAAVCELTARKLGLDALQRQLLMRAALTMNIGMARDQDSLARQNSKPTEWQRTLIGEHPQISVDILRGFGLEDPDVLDIVRWHHAPDAPEALPRTLASRRLLNLADSFVARTAARKTRSSIAAVKAVKSMILNAEGAQLWISSAMAQVVGFYPPGSYVQLVNGETAVAVQRGERANMPWVISITDKDGIPTGRYACQGTASPAEAIRAPVNSETVRVTLSSEKVRRARERIPR